MTDKDKTLRKGLQILDLLSMSDGPRGAADIARQLDLTRSNAFRLMATLTQMGYLRRADEAGRYEPTLKSWEIGMRIMGRDPLRRVAQPWLRQLQNVVGFNVYLAILDASDILYLDKVETETMSHVSAQPGMRLPAFLVASGHAILASMPDESVLEIRASHPRGAEIERHALLSSLMHVREKGWARTVSGSRPGVTSIAAPIYGRHGQAAAALAVSGPSKDFFPAKENQIADQTMNGALRIASML